MPNAREQEESDQAGLGNPADEGGSGEAGDDPGGARVGLVATALRGAVTMSGYWYVG